MSNSERIKANRTTTYLVEQPWVKILEGAAVIGLAEGCGDLTLAQYVEGGDFFLPAAANSATRGGGSAATTVSGGSAAEGVSGWSFLSIGVGIDVGVFWEKGGSGVAWVNLGRWGIIGWICGRLVEPSGVVDGGGGDGSGGPPGEIFKEASVYLGTDSDDKHFNPFPSAT